MDKKKITFADIAKYTNFSKTTISRYFNNPDSLTLENQEIIAQALIDLDYQENKLAKVFANAIERLFYSNQLRIGKAVLPQANVRSRLWDLDGIILQSVQSKLAANQRDVKNSTAYTMAVIFNTICEAHSDLLVDPYLNGAGAPPEPRPDEVLPRCPFVVAGFRFKKNPSFKKKKNPRLVFFRFYYFASVHRTVRFNERVRRFFSVNERPFFNRSSVFLFRRIFSLFSQIRFLIESSFLFNFSLVYRNQAIQAPRVSSRNSLSV